MTVGELNIILKNLNIGEILTDIDRNIELMNADDSTDMDTDAKMEVDFETVIPFAYKKSRISKKHKKIAKKSKKISRKSRKISRKSRKIK